MIRERLTHRATPAQAGFALIEVLVSLLVLSVGIVPAFAVFPRSHANAGTAQNLQIASQLGTDSIEQLRASPWATLRTGALRHSATYPASAPVTDRVTFSGGLPTAYTPSGKPTEPLVATAAATSSQPLDYQEVAVDGRRFGVYRFASWRKESCPLINLTTVLGGHDGRDGLDISTALTKITGLQSQITSVNSAIGTVTTDLSGRPSALNSLIGNSPGTGGSLATLTTTANSALTKASSITGDLLTFLTPALNTTTKTNIDSQVTAIASIRTALQTQQTTLATLSSQLTAATSQLSTLGSSLTSLSTQLINLQSAVTTATGSGLMSGDLLDLCQLPDDFELPKVTDLELLTPKLAEAGTTLDALGIGGPNTLTTLGANLTSLGTSLTNLTTSQGTLSTKLSTLTRDITSQQSQSLPCISLLGGTDAKESWKQASAVIPRTHPRDS